MSITPDEITYSKLAQLASFVRYCSADSFTRQMTALTLLMVLAQCAGPNVFNEPPGFLLINAGPLQKDPLDAMAYHLRGLAEVQPSAKNEEERKRAIRMMYFLYNPQLGQNHDNKTRHIILSQIDEHRSIAFGGAHIGCYSHRYDKVLGWITCPSDHVILRLESDQDRKALVEDIRKKAEKLKPAMGKDPFVGKVEKKLSLSGSISFDQWDDALVKGILDRGLFILPLPHFAQEPLKGFECSELSMLAIQLLGLSKGYHIGLADSMKVFTSWFVKCHARLRKRLVLLPENYAWIIEKFVRQIPNWSERIAKMMVEKDTPRQDLVYCWVDLIEQAIGGLCIAIEALGWHGYGFEEEERKDLLRLLTAVREKGTLSKRDLLRRCQWLNAKRRDPLLAELERERLIELGENSVTAMTFENYLRLLPEKMGLGEPRMLGEVKEVHAPSIRDLAKQLLSLRGSLPPVKLQNE